MVNLGAVKVKSDRNIEYIDPEKRNCYFDDEHPPNQPLTAHKKYSQVLLSWFCRWTWTNKVCCLPTGVLPIGVSHQTCFVTLQWQRQVPPLVLSASGSRGPVVFALWIKELQPRDGKDAPWRVQGNIGHDRELALWYAYKLRRWMLGLLTQLRRDLLHLERVGSPVPALRLQKPRNDAALRPRARQWGRHRLRQH